MQDGIAVQKQEQLASRGSSALIGRQSESEIRRIAQNRRSLESLEKQRRVVG